MNHSLAKSSQLGNWSVYRLKESRVGCNAFIRYLALIIPLAVVLTTLLGHTPFKVGVRIINVHLVRL